MPQHQPSYDRSTPRPVPTVRDPLLYDDENPMSKDRQKFLIICVFDFALATLLWLLSTVTRGDDWSKIFLHEINLFEPHFLQTSLFDIVIVVFLRMIVLLICFAWLRLDHWLPVALSTTISTIYIIIKILFFFNKNNGALPQYLMIISAFIIAWIELWLLPFRVLAHERRLEVGSIESPPTEITVVRSLHGNEDDFRSALEYSTDDDEAGSNRLRSITPLSKMFIRLTSEMREECFRIAEDTESKAREIITEVNTWKQMNMNPEVRYSGNLNSFYIKKEYHCSPKSLFTAKWRDNVAWNVQAKSSTILYPLDPNVELVRSISEPAMNGYISSRDFIDVKKVSYDKDNEIYFCTYSSVSTIISQHVPIIDGLVRGINGINIVRITSTANGSLLEYVMNTDVKVRVPRMAMRGAQKSFLINYVDALEKHIAQYPDKYP